MGMSPKGGANQDSKRGAVFKGNFHPNTTMHADFRSISGTVKQPMKYSGVHLMNNHNLEKDKPPFLYRQSEDYPGSIQRKPSNSRYSAYFT